MANSTLTPNLRYEILESLLHNLFQQRTQELSQRLDQLLLANQQKDPKKRLYFRYKTQVFMGTNASRHGAISPLLDPSLEAEMEDWLADKDELELFQLGPIKVYLVDCLNHCRTQGDFLALLPEPVHAYLDQEIQQAAREYPVTLTKAQIHTIQTRHSHADRLIRRLIITNMISQ